MAEGSLPDEHPALLAPEQAPAPARGGVLTQILRWLPLVVLIGGGIAAFVIGVGDYVSMSAIVESRETLHNYVADRPATALAAYTGIYILAVIFSVPGGSLLTVLGGIMFSGLVGGLVTTFAATLGSVSVYLVARTALGDWMRHRLEFSGPRLTALAEGFRKNAFYLLVVLRLIPVMPYWASNAVPALLNVRLRVFIPATIVGLLPWTVSFAFFGHALDEIVGAQELANPGCAAANTCELDFSTLMSGPVLTGIVIALLALVPVVGHWWLKRRRARNAAAAEA
jgi:uncharacterized membrane protein YdjX (TVP38/TMEM64 family)